MTARRIATGALLVASGALLADALLARAGSVFASHDVAWTVAAGVRVLDGASFSVEIVDNNPPLIYWLCAGVAALGRALGAPALTTYYAAALAAIAASAVLVGAVLRRSLGDAGWADGLAITAAALLVWMPGYEFGQRDHLMLVLALPYVVAAAAWASGAPRGRGLRAAIGLLAGVGIALKPHFTLLWLAVEATLLARRREPRLLLRAECVGIGGVIAAYVLAVLVFAPAYLRDLPLLFQLHAAYGKPVALASGTTALVALAVLGAWLPFGWPAPREASRTTASAALACLAAFHLQAMDFGYQGLPARVSAALSLVLAAAALLGAVAPLRRWPWPRELAALALTGLALFAAPQVPTPGPRNLRVALVNLIEARAQGAPVVFFTGSVPPTYPVLNFTRSRSASPYSCLWLIPTTARRSADAGPSPTAASTSCPRASVPS